MIMHFCQSCTDCGLKTDTPKKKKKNTPDFTELKQALLLPDVKLSFTFYTLIQFLHFKYAETNSICRMYYVFYSTLLPQ